MRIIAGNLTALYQKQGEDEKAEPLNQEYQASGRVISENKTQEE